MIHYNIWFNFKNDSERAKDLGVVQEFLCELYAAGSIAGFQILTNSGDTAKTKMLHYQALIKFRDDAQFSAAFSAQAAHGIHAGLHGLVMSLVSDFHIEIFKQIAASGDSAAKEPSSQQACEI
jgi:hypothetical protein